MMLLAAMSFASCTEEEGTDVGNDPAPSITLYQYAVEAPYNSDNDVKLRLAVNNKVKDVYYLSELTSDYDSRMASLGEAGYADYVVQNGTKVDLAAGELDKDVYVTGLIGTYTITVAAVNGNAKSMASTEFVGAEWVKYKSATVKFAFANEQAVTPSLAQPHETEVQYAAALDKYRIVDMWGTGVNVVFSWPDNGVGISFDKSSITPGLTHASYGAMAWAPSSSSSFYSVEYNAFAFAGTYSVGAGSFGATQDVIYLHD